MTAEVEIKVSTETLTRLKKHAEPFVDTPESVIRRLLDSYESDPSLKPGPLPAREVQTFPGSTSPIQVPNLRHAKVTLAYLDGRLLDAPSWNRLMYEAVRYARKKTGSVRELKSVALLNLVEGRKEDEGYHYLADVGLSVQGQDANGAWRAVAQIASRLGFNVEVDFTWRAKEGAERPGESGHLSSGRRT